MKPHTVFEVAIASTFQGTLRNDTVNSVPLVICLKLTCSYLSRIKD